MTQNCIVIAPAPPTVVSLSVVKLQIHFTQMALVRLSQTG